MDIPLCQSEHKPQLLLNDPAAISLYHTAPEKFAGALAPNAELCDAWAEELAPLPVGLALACPPEPDAEHCERPITMHYIEQCKEVFRPLLHDDAAFYYLHGAPTFPALRAAVLALGDLCGRTVIAELHVEDDEGHLPDGTDVRAAIGVLQRIGVRNRGAVCAAVARRVHARGLAVSNHTVQHRGHCARHYGSICRSAARQSGGVQNAAARSR